MRTSSVILNTILGRACTSLGLCIEVCFYASLPNHGIMAFARRAIPLLDIADWRASPKRFATQLREACHRVGFFTLRHGLPDGMAAGTLESAREFFALDTEHKLRMDYRNSPAFRGYMPLGVENTGGLTDLREQVELAADGPPARPDAWPPRERLCGRNQWPDEAMPGLRPRIEAFASHMSSLSEDLRTALGLALGLPAGQLDSLFEPEPHWQLKLTHYPPAVAAADSEAIGVGAHTDSGFLTLLLQDDVGGLQAHTGGEWVDVPPAGPDVLVCNIGECAQMASGGYLLATPHRVLSSASSRISVPYFYNPALKATVRNFAVSESLPWERDDQAAEQARWRTSSNAQLPEYGANAFKSLARSHPVVMATHHPDLEVLGDGRIVARSP